MKISQYCYLIAIYCFCWVTISCGELKAQGEAIQTSSDMDNCLVHLDKPFYVNGETIWYKVYLPASLQQVGAVFQISICDKKGDILKSHYVKAQEGGLVSGYISIPFKWKAEVYHLIVSAQAGKGLRFFQFTDIPIPIYNDESIPAIEKEMLDGEKLLEVAEGSNRNLLITTEKGNYKSRELIKVNLKLSDEQGNLFNGHASVSVKDKSLIPTQNPNYPNFFEGNKIKQAFLLDDHIYLKANLVDNLNQLVFSGTLVAYSASINKVLKPLTDGLGNFSLELPDVYGRQQLQWVDIKNPQAIISQQKTIKISNPKELSYTPEVIQYLNFSRERKKLYQLFGQIETGVLVEVPQVAQDSIIPDRKYEMRDYDPFPDLPTFFQEILTPLKARRTRGGVVYKMLNTEERQKSYYPATPVFIVNQYVITNTEIINKLNYQDVEYIEMFNGYYKLVTNFGGLGLNGVVKISTNQDVSFLDEKVSNVSSIDAFQAPAIFPQSNEIPIYTPNLRPLIFWKSDIMINQDGVGEFSFFHTDDLGVFEIEVAAQDKNGRIIRKTISYSVDN